MDEIKFHIEKINVTKKSRMLNNGVSMEWIDELSAIHGLDAEAELANILGSEILNMIKLETLVTLPKNIISQIINA